MANRTTTIRVNQKCVKCGKELIKGNKVIVKTYPKGRTMKRFYECLDHNRMFCTSCGKECFDNQYPEVVFKNENNYICEECSIDYEEIKGKICERNITV